MEERMTILENAVLAHQEALSQHAILLRGLNADRTDMLARFIVSVAMFDALAATCPEHAAAIAKHITDATSRGPASLAPGLRERIRDVSSEIIGGLNGNDRRISWN